jgi:hypothetical protein
MLQQRFSTQTYMPFVQAHLLGFGLHCRQGLSRLGPGWDKGELCLVNNNGSATGTSKESHTVNKRARYYATPSRARTSLRNETLFSTDGRSPAAVTVIIILKHQMAVNSQK